MNEAKCECGNIGLYHTGDRRVEGLTGYYESYSCPVCGAENIEIYIRRS